ncbi:acetate uptake transporter [Desulfuromonas thiophila]|nr:acetate uptake transporter [Desulfuromonas thiophila]
MKGRAMGQPSDPANRPSRTTTVVKPFRVNWPDTSLLQQVLRAPLPSRERPASPLALPDNATACLLTDHTANPAPLGLLGFGMTTLLLGLHHAGFFPLDAMLLAMGIFCGGLGQILVGVMEWNRNNCFGATAFTSYGLFWLSLVALILLPATGLITASSPFAMGFYLSIWGLFSAVLFLASFRLSRALQLVFGSLMLLFFLLAAADFSGNASLERIAGYEGICCGLSALYAGLGQMLNEVFCASLVPLGLYREPFSRRR